MSGFVVGRGPSAKVNVPAMFERISHRGRFCQGAYARGSVCIAQNYLQADWPDVQPAEAAEAAPVMLADRDALRLAYDGQIGNASELAQAAGVSDGPFRAEQAILGLYRQHGAGVLELLGDAIFALVIVDGDEVLAARDFLGVKTLYYGRGEDGTLYFASELKSLSGVVEDVHAFPPGCWMDATGTVTRFADLPTAPPAPIGDSPETMAKTVHEILDRSVRCRVDFKRPTACLLSGGMDSSAITALANELHRERFGPDKKLATFAVGAADSGDLAAARRVAEHLGTNHEEVVIDLDDMLAVLPELIYVLELFDPSSVRSSISNFIISRHAARRGYEVLLSGEGGDELFCGYAHFKDLSEKERFDGQMEAIRYVKNTAALRLDRTNQWSSVRVVTPFVSGELYEYTMRIPMEYKVRDVEGRTVEKWILRKAFEGDLPREIIERTKQEFSQGSGVAALMPKHFETVYSDAELAAAQAEHPVVRTKEEMHYFRLFAEHYGTGSAVATVGQWKHF